jgi:hypothetical protein
VERYPKIVQQVAGFGKPHPPMSNEVYKQVFGNVLRWITQKIFKPKYFIPKIFRLNFNHEVLLKSFLSACNLVVAFTSIENRFGPGKVSASCNVIDDYIGHTSNPFSWLYFLSGLLSDFTEIRKVPEVSVFTQQLLFSTCAEFVGSSVYLSLKTSIKYPSIAPKAFC